MRKHRDRLQRFGSSLQKQILRLPPWTRGAAYGVSSPAVDRSRMVAFNGKWSEAIRVSGV